MKFPTTLVPLTVGLSTAVLVLAPLAGASPTAEPLRSDVVGCLSWDEPISPTTAAGWWTTKVDATCFGKAIRLSWKKRMTPTHGEEWTGSGTVFGSSIRVSGHTSESGYGTTHVAVNGKRLAGESGHSIMNIMTGSIGAVTFGIDGMNYGCSDVGYGVHGDLGLTITKAPYGASLIQGPLTSPEVTGIVWGLCAAVLEMAQSSQPGDG